MTLFLSAEDVSALATHEVAIAAALDAVRADCDGGTTVPPRLDVELERGFLRVMPGAVGVLMGMKVMTLVEGIGNRYLLLVYSQETGELLALLDADEVTRLRTAATTAVAAGLLQPEPQSSLGLVGSGFEATGHLRALAQVWPLSEVTVFSPNPERRAAFAEQMTTELGIPVRAAASCTEVCESASTLVLATKSQAPVIDGADLQRNAVVLSIGSTRPVLRELDHATLRRSAVVLVDDAEQVGLESGDIIESVGTGALEPDQLVSMGTALSQPEALARYGDRDVLVFKSVGTIVQDLTLAGALIEAATDKGVGRSLGELTHLKVAPGAPPAAARSAT